MNLPTHLTNRGAEGRRVDLFHGLASRPDKGKGTANENASQEQHIGRGSDDGPDVKRGDGSFQAHGHGSTPVPQSLLRDDSAQRPGSRREEDSREKRTHPCYRVFEKAFEVLRRHLAFVGPGIVASVAYTDPGNWVTDLAAGSQFGYALLFIVLLSGCFGIFLQILAVRMGVVTGFDLARNTRILLLAESADGRPLALRRGSVAERTPSSISGTGSSRVRFRMARRIALWVLYGVSEGAIVATELAELLGSAIALNLLFPKLPLYAGVLITSADVLLILLVYRPNGNFRIFEILIGILVLIVMACYVALLVRTKPHWPSVFHGYIPSSTLVEPQALYTGVGIIGAVIMPHALYLGSHFSTMNRTSSRPSSADAEVTARATTYEDEDTPESKNWIRMLRTLRSRVQESLPDLSRGPHVGNGGESRFDDDASPHIPAHLQTTPRISSFSPLHNRMSIAEMKQHLPHAAWDIGLSLFFLAITVNSAILVVAAAAFHFGPGPHNVEVGDLFDAFNLLRNTLGHAYAILFAIALLAAGQAASITCTLAGQIVSEGFINWRTNPFVRRLLTRVVTIVPSLTIAIAVGRSGLDKALVASQVALSFALPFVIVPLALVTSMSSRMKIEEVIDEEADGASINVEQDYFGCYAQPQQNASAAHVGDHHGQATPAVDVDEIAPTSSNTFGNDTPCSKTRNALASGGQGSLAADTPPVHHTASSSAPLNSGAVAALWSRMISHDFTNGRIVQTLAAVIFAVIVVADVYTLVTTFQGKQ